MRVTLAEILILLLIALLVGLSFGIWAYIAVCWSWGGFRAWRYKVRRARILRRLL